MLVVGGLCFFLLVSRTNSSSIFDFCFVLVDLRVVYTVSSVVSVMFLMFSSLSA